MSQTNIPQITDFRFGSLVISWNRVEILPYLHTFAQKKYTSQTTALLLMALEGRGDTYGRSFPSDPLLMRDTGATQPTITRARDTIFSLGMAFNIPPAERTGKAKEIDRRRYNYQLTGIAILPNGRIVDYLKLTPQQIIERVEELQRRAIAMYRVVDASPDAAPKIVVDKSILEGRYKDDEVEIDDPRFIVGEELRVRNEWLVGAGLDPLKHGDEIFATLNLKSFKLNNFKLKTLPNKYKRFNKDNIESDLDLESFDLEETPQSTPTIKPFNEASASLRAVDPATGEITGIAPDDSGEDEEIETSAAPTKRTKADRELVNARLKWCITGDNPRIKLVDKDFAMLGKATKKLLAKHDDMTAAEICGLIDRAVLWYCFGNTWNQDSRLPHNAITITNDNWQAFINFDVSHVDARRDWFILFEDSYPTWRDHLHSKARYGWRKDFERIVESIRDDKDFVDYNDIIQR